MVPVASLLQLTLQHFVILALGQATSPSLHLAPRLQQETSHQVLEVFFLITLEGPMVPAVVSASPVQGLSGF